MKHLAPKPFAFDRDTQNLVKTLALSWVLMLLTIISLGITTTNVSAEETMPAEMPVLRGAQELPSMVASDAGLFSSKTFLDEFEDDEEMTALHEFQTEVNHQDYPQTVQNNEPQQASSTTEEGFHNTSLSSPGQLPPAPTLQTQSTFDASGNATPDAIMPVSSTVSSSNSTGYVLPENAEPPRVFEKTKEFMTRSKDLVYYTPLETVAIFPVFKDGPRKAFWDVSKLVAREFASEIEGSIQGTTVIHPIFTPEELLMKGLGRLYDKMMDHYVEAGRPEPVETAYLLGQLSTPDRPISRVIFVEADFDLSNPYSPKGFTGLLSRARNVFDDSLPKTSKYYIRSRVQVFDTEQKEMPMLWAKSWRKSVRADDFYNVTPSVFADGDSERAFGRAARLMSQDMMLVAPKEALMQRNVETGVKARIAGQSNK